MERKPIIRPGMFSIQAAADSRRLEFDAKNEVIVHNGVPVDYVFIGDSITHGWELNAYFGRQGRLILNRGIGGDTAEYMLRRFEADVLQLSPRFAVVMIGVNDTWKLGDAAAERHTPEAVIEHLAAVMRQLTDRSEAWGQRLILCSVLPTRDPGNASEPVRNRLIAEHNARVRSLAESCGHLYVDYHGRMTDSDGLTLREGLAHDGVHPHVLGYNLMAETLRETLAQHHIDI